jgi:hypothetical protein
MEEESETVRAAAENSLGLTKQCDGKSQLAGNQGWEAIQIFLLKLIEKKNPKLLLSTADKLFDPNWFWKIGCCHPASHWFLLADQNGILPFPDKRGTSQTEQTW